MVSYDKLIEKWSPVLNEESAGKITDHHKKAVTAAVLENQEIALREEGLITEAAPANATSSVNNWNPVLIALVRRAMPNLMAYDICGVQPMSGPTGLIFAMKSRYGGGSTSNREALFNEAETQFSGDSASTHDSDNASGLNVTNLDSDSTADDARLTSIMAGGMTTAEAEKLGVTFLNEIPLNISLRTTSDEGNPIVHKEPNNSISKKYMEIGSKILNQIQTNGKQPPQIIQ